MVAVATDTFATNMQSYPSQPHLSRGAHILIKTVSIGSSHMESPTGPSQASLKQHLPTFHYRTSSLCCLSIFSSLEHSKHPSKYKRDFNRCWEVSSRIIFPFQRKFPLLEIASFFPPYSNTHSHSKGTCNFNRPWCSSLNGIRASTELFINNFFNGHPIFPHLNFPATIPSKRYMQFQSPFILP